MIKGVRVGGTGPALSYLDTLELPIIENTPNEEDLKDSMAEAMIKYPNAAGILVRRHGVYVWGPFSFCACFICRNNILSTRGWLGKGQDTDWSSKSLLWFIQCLTVFPVPWLLVRNWSQNEACRFAYHPELKITGRMAISFLMWSWILKFRCIIIVYNNSSIAMSGSWEYARGHITCWRVVSFWERHALNLTHDQSPPTWQQISQF